MGSNQPWLTMMPMSSRSRRSRMILMLHLPLVVFVVVQQIEGSSGQQTYVNNKQLDCDKNHSVAEGYVCNGNGDGDGDHGAVSSSCLSYLTFRSSPPYYYSPATIGYLLGADPSEIARINNISDVNPIPTDTLVIVPIANCSCFHLLLPSNNNNNGSSTTESYYYYQHNASYTLKTQSETYFSVANNTYEGLTTCQSLIAQNPYNFRNLAVGMKLSIPLRCACPSPNQTDAGVRYLLSYLVTWGDTIEYIAETFGVDNQSIYDANELSPSSLIFPFTPILVPLKTEPTKINTSAASPPPPPSSPELPAVPVGNQSSSSRKWVFVGAGIGAVVLLLLALSGFLFWFFRSRRRSRHGESVPDRKKPVDSADYTAVTTDGKSWSVSEGVRYAIGSLTLYKFEELQKATGFFGEANRIKGSFAYRGSFNGDAAAVKVMKGDVSEEINILKQINHSNIIRLSGFCVHDGNTYLVYEYAENGSLNDWLLYSKSKSGSSLLGWKQRVQIARDVADALNYLHNYTSPPCIHKNLKSSNVLVDGEFRAKLSNFGLARRSVIDTGGSQEELQLTRHVVGTYGYMAPEYIENGLVTPKLDVFAFGVVMLELLSGREAAAAAVKKKKKKKKMMTMNDGEEVVVEVAEEEEEEEEELLSATISQVVGGDNVREKLRGFIDPSLGSDYPLDLAYSSAQLANNCVAYDPNSRPAISDVFTTLSKILSSSMDWDPSHELDNFSRSTSHGEQNSNSKKK